MPDAREMFNDLVPYLDNIDNIWYQEQALWSNELGLAGRVDCIAEYEGELSVIDFKTSKRVKTKDKIQDYFWQTCAYALMTEELTGYPINNLTIIMAVDNEKPIIFKEKTEDHIDGLVKAIQFYKDQK
jgi:genome maintenance exonuclease 1